jgi:hypothetical protein
MRVLSTPIHGVVRGGTFVFLAFAALGAVLLLSSETAAGDPQAKPASLSGHTVVFADSGNSLADLHSVRAQCPPGKGVIAGGYSLSNSGIEDFVVLSNHPGPQFTVQPQPGPPQVNHDGWDVQIRRLDEFTIPWGVLAYAVCVDTE